MQSGAGCAIRQKIRPEICVCVLAHGVSGCELHSVRPATRCANPKRQSHAALQDAAANQHATSKIPRGFFSAACDCRFSEAPMRAQYFQSLLKSLREWAEPRFK
jgi:hypothetical protein